VRQSGCLVPRFFAFGLCRQRIQSTQSTPSKTLGGLGLKQGHFDGSPHDAPSSLSHPSAIAYFTNRDRRLAQPVDAYLHLDQTGAEIEGFGRGNDLASCTVRGDLDESGGLLLHENVLGLVTWARDITRDAEEVRMVACVLLALVIAFRAARATMLKHLLRRPHTASDLACMTDVLVALTAQELDYERHDDPPGEQP
jgi:hypothetical protein